MQVKEKEDKFKKPVMFFAPDSWHMVLNRTCRSLGMSKSEVLRQGLFSFLRSKQAKEKKALMGR